MATDLPTILFRDDLLVCAAWRDVFFEVWLGQGGGRHFRTLRHHQLTFARGRPDQRVAIVSIVQLPSLSTIEAEVRHEAATRTKEMKPHTKAAAIVIETKGFAGSLIRGVITGLTLADRSIAPTKIFDTVPPAITWLASHLDRAGGALTGREVQHAYDTALAQSGAVGVLRA
jgi:hypothetical protein